MQGWLRAPRTRLPGPTARRGLWRLLPWGSWCRGGFENRRPEALIRPQVFLRKEGRAWACGTGACSGRARCRGRTHCPSSGEDTRLPPGDPSPRHSSAKDKRTPKPGRPGRPGRLGLQRQGRGWGRPVRARVNRSTAGTEPLGTRHHLRTQSHPRGAHWRSGLRLGLASHAGPSRPAPNSPRPEKPTRPPAWVTVHGAAVTGQCDGHDNGPPWTQAVCRRGQGPRLP